MIVFHRAEHTVVPKLKMPSDPDLEKNEDETGSAEETGNVPKQSGLSQSNKDDIGVCVVIILVSTHLFTLVTHYVFRSEK